jgi:hypothetical protein
LTNSIAYAQPDQSLTGLIARRRVGFRLLGDEGLLRAPAGRETPYRVCAATITAGPSTLPTQHVSSRRPQRDRKSSRGFICHCNICPMRCFARVTKGPTGI